MSVNPRVSEITILGTQDKAGKNQNYTFNQRNQLIAYKKEDENNNTLKTLSYTYDAFNRRVSKTEDNNVTQKYLYDGDDIVAILDNNKQVIATITHDESIDTPLSITNANGTFYYHRDHQGSIIALTDSSGAVVESFTYDNHYGTITKHTKTTETNNPYGYTGRELDTEELYYYRARYYDPSLQRFLGEDPIGFSGKDFNFYRYVKSSPITFYDPRGLLELCTTKHFIYHQYWKDGNKSIGFHPKNSIFFGDGIYKKDDHEKYKNDSMCLAVGNDTCITECILNYKLYNNAPMYDLFLHNCRDEAMNMYYYCQLACGK